MFRRYVLPWLVYFVYRLWSATWRVRVIEPESLKAALRDGEPIVFAHWHGDELKVIPLIPLYRIATMTSTSKDGELIDFALRRLGGATSRGSSTRGGSGALKGLIRLMKSGYRASLAVDGPKGPLHRAKPGIFELSRLAQARIVPVGAAADRVITFHKSWNKAQLPKPFSRITVKFNEPMPALTREDSAKDPALAARLEQEIAKACFEAAQDLR